MYSIYGSSVPSLAKGFTKSFLSALPPPKDLAIAIVLHSLINYWLISLHCHTATVPA